MVGRLNAQVIFRKDLPQDSALRDLSTAFDCAQTSCSQGRWPSFVIPVGSPKRESQPAICWLETSLNRFLMGYFYNRVDISTGIEVSLNGDLQRVNSGDKIIQNLINRLFVGDVAIAVAIDIELDSLQLHHSLIRYVGDIDSGKVRIAGKWTFAGKLWQGDMDIITATWAGIWERNQRSLDNFALAILDRWPIYGCRGF